jgi:hypothetical protein
MFLQEAFINRYFKVHFAVCPVCHKADRKTPGMVYFNSLATEKGCGMNIKPRQCR